ncbi:hypothetical protein, partial [Luteibacter sp. 22Crub2.1]|uniref:hypothetical protein n=1 Tax=Luteibacter sp. 22Crub2.1 TaxID=1283288 RepID=UPI001590F7E0
VTRWLTNPQQSLANTKALVDGFTQEYRKDLAAGDFAKLSGRVVFGGLTVATPFVAAKFGDASALAKAADEAAASARAAEEAAAANRSTALGDSNVPHDVGDASVGRRAKVPVQMYDVMTHGESKAGAVVGDELTGDHIPSYAAIRQNVEAVLGRELTADEAVSLRDNTNTVIIAKDLHAAGRTYFGANTQAQIARDSFDLTGAAVKDQAVHLENAAGLKYSPEKLQNSFGRLNQANQKLFNQLSSEQSIVDFFTRHGVY